MSKAKAECASLTVRNTTWKDIDSSKYERKVRKLQVRIAKAHKEKRYNKVKALRYLLATSYEAKALAIRKVTSNKGKRTAGVDHMKWDTDAKKIEAICLLKRRGYKAFQLRKVNIAKANGKTRSLGIPTMKDRAVQDISYGFRTYNWKWSGCELIWVQKV